MITWSPIQPLQIKINVWINDTPFGFVMGLALTCIPIGIPKLLDIQFCIDDLDINDQEIRFTFSVRAEALFFDFIIWQETIIIPLTE